nr:BspA family leucine-rich repeat surface protein [Mycoplasmopsis bovis]
MKYRFCTIYGRNVYWCNTHFNQDISKWNTSNVTDMTSMFWDATNFNQNLNSWDVKKVISMQNMFSGTQKFNSALDKWEPKSLRSVYGMFANSKFNKSLKSWERHFPKKLLNAQYFKRNAILEDDKLPETIINSIKILWRSEKRQVTIPK